MGLVDDVKKVLDMQDRAAELRRTAERISVWADQYEGVAASLVEGMNDGTYTPEVAAKKAGEAACFIDERYSVYPHQTSDATSPTERKGRGPDKAPRKRGSVRGPNGPTPEEIAADSAHLMPHLKDGPLTIGGLEALTGWSPAKLIDVLTNDPERWVGWTGRREGDAGPVDLWGTREQFYAYVTDRYDLREKAMTVAVLTGAVRSGAAAAAWAIDRARQEVAL